MNEERLSKVIVGPCSTEKAQIIADKFRQIAFKVLPSATKAEIKKAVELHFKVEVSQVTTLNVKGKTKRFSGRLGKRKDWKKAYVTLKEGFDINFGFAE
jgi:large subunit ribosomal protein L23